jgi:hypothetical protein
MKNHIKSKVAAKIYRNAAFILRIVETVKIVT